MHSQVQLVKHKICITGNNIVLVNNINDNYNKRYTNNLVDMHKQWQFILPFVSHFSLLTEEKEAMKDNSLTIAQ